MNILCEYIEPEAIPFDIDHMTKQVCSLTIMNLNRHLRDILRQWYIETTVNPNLTVLNNPEFFKYLFSVKNLVPTLVFSPDDSIRYEKKGTYQYRLSFVPQIKLDKSSYKDYDKREFVVNNVVIDVYQPMLFVHANISNMKMNSFSIVTLVHIENIPGIPDVYTKEFLTRIDNMNFIVKLKDGSFVTEIYQKYVNRKVDLDFDVEMIRDILFKKIKDFKEDIQNRFNESVQINDLSFLNGFDLFYHLNFTEAIKKVNFSLDDSTKNRNVFHNHTDLKTVNPVFLFNNFAILYPPFIRLDIFKKSDEKNTYTLTITIVIDNIPTTEKYFIINQNPKYVFTYSESWED